MQGGGGGGGARPERWNHGRLQFRMGFRQSARQLCLLACHFSLPIKPSHSSSSLLACGVRSLSGTGGGLIRTVTRRSPGAARVRPTSATARRRRPFSEDGTLKKPEDGLREKKPDDGEREKVPEEGVLEKVPKVDMSKSRLEVLRRRRLLVGGASSAVPSESRSKATATPASRRLICETKWGEVRGGRRGRASKLARGR